jgi:two-component system chemotaxis response regulator CheB
MSGRPCKKVVFVDDSKVIRGWLRAVLEKDKRLIVAGEAKDAVEAPDIIKQTTPDVITLDIEMPAMSRLGFLKKLMTLRPTPIVMISCRTKRNSEATVRALSLGAVDCIVKPITLGGETIFRDISRRVFSTACSSVQASRSNPCANQMRFYSINDRHIPLILIAA